MTPDPYLTELAQSMAPSLEPVTRPFHIDFIGTEPEAEPIADECLLPDLDAMRAAGAI